MQKIQEYVREVPETRRGKFKAILGLIQDLYPSAEVSMKYKMPTFQNGDAWIAVANQKSYISVYTCMEQHIAGFKKRHPKIKTGKGCINFQDKDDIPLKELKPVVVSAMEHTH